jgi:hypothetical protein
MTRRLQVLLDDAELSEVQAAARARHLTVAEYVRGVLRSAREEPAVTAARKLAVLRRAVRHEYPTAEIDQMNAEIEAGFTEKAEGSPRA